MPAATHATRFRSPEDDASALIIIDMINDFDFENGQVLADKAIRCADVIAPLADRMRRLELPVIYVNDNLGRWRSSFPELISYCREQSDAAARILDLLCPAKSDYQVLKPAHSAFFGTPLEILLHRLGVGHLVLSGVTTEYCIHFTAVEAYFRQYDLTVIEDGTAAVDKDDHDKSIDLMQRVLDAQIITGADLSLGSRQAISADAEASAAPAGKADL